MTTDWRYDSVIDLKYDFFTFNFFLTIFLRGITEVSAQCGLKTLCFFSGFPQLTTCSITAQLLGVCGQNCYYIPKCGCLIEQFLKAIISCQIEFYYICQCEVVNWQWLVQLIQCTNVHEHAWLTNFWVIQVPFRGCMDSMLL